MNPQICMEPIWWMEPEWATFFATCIIGVGTIIVFVWQAIIFRSHAKAQEDIATAMKAQVELTNFSKRWALLQSVTNSLNVLYNISSEISGNPTIGFTGAEKSQLKSMYRTAQELLSLAEASSFALGETKSKVYGYARALYDFQIDDKDSPTGRKKLKEINDEFQPGAIVGKLGRIRGSEGTLTF